MWYAIRGTNAQKVCNTHCTIEPEAHCQQLVSRGSTTVLGLEKKTIASVQKPGCFSAVANRRPCTAARGGSILRPIVPLFLDHLPSRSRFAAWNSGGRWEDGKKTPSDSNFPVPVGSRRNLQFRLVLKLKYQESMQPCSQQRDRSTPHWLRTYGKFKFLHVEQWAGAPQRNSFGLFFV